MSNNLNSAEAFAIIDNSVISLEEWKKIDKLFGLGLISDTPDVSDEIVDKIIEREKAREEKNYSHSDGIRNELAARGISLRDTSDGAVWEYLN
jgi:cysteinyl-tRNA synthetase